MSKSLFSLTFVSLSLLLWGTGTLASSYLSRGFIRAEAQKRQEALSQISPQLNILSARLEDHPNDSSLRLQVADLRTREALKTGNGSLLMSAVQDYRAVLDVEPQNTHAMLGIASLCFEAGILDKALDYYAQYLSLRPDDLAVRADYALTHLRAGNFAQAKEVALAVVAKDESVVPAQMTLALIAQMQNDIPQATSAARKALSLAKDEGTRQKIEFFIARLAHSSQQASDKQEQVSPATQVVAFLKNHPIIGPKIISIKWPSENAVEVFLKDFPVSKMPPFAVEALRTKVERFVSTLVSPVKISLIDQQERSERLDF